MPTKPYTLPQPVDRLRHQRWLLDEVIETVRPEFDQSRPQHHSAPMSPDRRGSVMGLEATIDRWDDLTPEFARLAHRYELQARASLTQGHEVTAGVRFFSASRMHGAAQRPLLADIGHNLTLECKRTDCCGDSTKFADRRIEAVEMRGTDT